MILRPVVSSGGKRRVGATPRDYTDTLYGHELLVNPRVRGVLGSVEHRPFVLLPA